MQNETQPTFWQSSTIGRFSRWFFSWRILRRISLTAAWVITAVVLFYGLVDWYGSRQWNAYRRQHEKTIGSLSFSDYVPAPVPDSENFAATPSADAWVTKRHETNLLSKDNYSTIRIPFYKLPKKQYQRHFEDLVEWKNGFDGISNQPFKDSAAFNADQSAARRVEAAPGILQGLNDDQALFDELLTASSKPYSRYPVSYDLENIWSTLLPHLSRIKATCLRLQLKASAELVLSQNQKALEDVKLIFYLANSIRTEPFLISYLVRIACLHIGIQPVWEGLADKKWTEPQLKVLQDELSHYNLLSDLRRPFQQEESEYVTWERALENHPIKTLKIYVDDGGDRSFSQLIFYVTLAPSGWLKLELLHLMQANDTIFAEIKKGAEPQLTVRQMKEFSSERKKILSGLGFLRSVWIHGAFTKVMLEDYSKSGRKGVAGQVDIDEATIACALERYRLAHGAYPDTLSQLIPRFAEELPNDPITSSDYKYRLNSDGRFVLYSVGWDEVDKGGVAGEKQFDDHGDWVWEYPTETSP